jgi:hypothetical protein
VERGEPYRYQDDPGNAKLEKNPVENRGIYPQAHQYFGRDSDSLNTAPKWTDWVKRYPFNCLEDQTGGDWRYNAGAEPWMEEPNLTAATARNHPFRHWGDFVGMLGHLVYRAPTVAANRDARMGVSAAAVCPGSFFDGSSIRSADCLQEPIVARNLYWPISANYGEYTNAGDGYPALETPWTDANEWKRRIDEWRGCDASGLRVEQHYISEAAANDVLVSFTNGRIRPIDFDGNGHVEMTRKDEIPQVATYWPGYPWHNLGGNDSVVEAQRAPASYNTVGGTNPLAWGLKRLRDAPAQVPFEHLPGDGIGEADGSQLPDDLFHAPVQPGLLAGPGSGGCGAGARRVHGRVHPARAADDHEGGSGDGVAGGKIGA